MRSRGRGLTLLEALVTMLMLSIVMGFVATLVRNFSSVNTHLEGKAQAQGGALILASVVGEIEAAFQVDQPPVGESAAVSELLLRKYAPTPSRLELGGKAAGWDPSYVLSVRYRQDGEELWRETTFPDATERTSRLTQRLSGFSAKRLGDHLIEIRASFRESKKLRTISAVAYRWRDQ